VRRVVQAAVGEGLRQLGRVVPLVGASALAAVLGMQRDDQAKLAKHLGNGGLHDLPPLVAAYSLRIRDGSSRRRARRNASPILAPV